MTVNKDTKVINIARQQHIYVHLQQNNVTSSSIRIKWGFL